MEGKFWLVVQLLIVVAAVISIALDRYDVLLDFSILLFTFGFLMFPSRSIEETKPGRIVEDAPTHPVLIPVFLIMISVILVLLNKAELVSGIFEIAFFFSLCLYIYKYASYASRTYRIHT